MSGGKRRGKKNSAKELAAKKKWEAFALAALTALGTAIGDGAAKAIPELFSHDNTPRIVEPVHPKDQQLHQINPDDKWPSGGEPTQRLRFTLIDKQGEKHSWVHEASIRQSALAAYEGVTFQPAEGDDHVVINAQLHPESPIFKFSVNKQSIMDRIASFGDLALTAKHVETVKHITISPEPNPGKPAQS